MSNGEQQNKRKQKGNTVRSTEANFSTSQIGETNIPLKFVAFHWQHYFLTIINLMLAILMSYASFLDNYYNSTSRLLELFHGSTLKQ
jgi:hypothetical protein